MTKSFLGTLRKIFKFDAVKVEDEPHREPELPVEPTVTAPTAPWPAARLAEPALPPRMQPSLRQQEILQQTKPRDYPSQAFTRPYTPTQPIRRQPQTDETSDMLAAVVVAEAVVDLFTDNSSDNRSDPPADDTFSGGGGEYGGGGSSGEW